MKKTTVLLIGLLLVFLGGYVAHRAQTSGSSIEIKDVRFMGSNGTQMSALLYIPDGVTSENPAPGILAIHGYINSRETQSPFAIEFARRGYVVLAPDQTGHGFSDPPAFANGFGGPDGLAYLRSLDIVDNENIGISGHSMGGWASLAAAGTYPDGYKAIVLEGSSVGAPFVGSPQWPRNLGLVYSEWDEFAQQMWGTPAYFGTTDYEEGIETAPDIVNSTKLKTLFGTLEMEAATPEETDTAAEEDAEATPEAPADSEETAETQEVAQASGEAVEIGRLYGSIEDGTARQLYMPRTTHPGDHLSTTAVANAVDWFQQTLEGGNGRDPDSQVWYWKEIGTLLGLIGMVMSMLAFGGLLLESPYFNDLAEPLPEARAIPMRGWERWVAYLLVAFIPIVTYFWFQNQAGDWFEVGSFWPQEITTGIVTWALGNGVIALVLFFLWHYFVNSKAPSAPVTEGTTAPASGTWWNLFKNYGVLWENGINWRKLGKSLLLAISVVFFAYLLLAISDFFFKTDFRFWVIGIKLMAPLHFWIFLSYLPFFAFFFLVNSMVLHGQLRQTDASGSPVTFRRAALVNVALMIGGFVVLILFQYVPLLTGSQMPLHATESSPLLSIVAFQFLGLLAITAVVTTYFFRKTGHIYVGAFTNALLLTWIIVASQAIHYAF